MGAIVNNLIIGLMVICLCRSTYETLDNSMVTIRNGTLQGVTLTSSEGRPFLAFKGIPYAKPPIGKLRFEAPEPPEPWQGILNATKDGEECPQVDFITSKVKGNESCLYLNVYTPKDRVQEFLPVLVFIHGGGFIMGTGNSNACDPIKFMDVDVVLVAINYRLGMLGFLSTEDENAPGNYGMLDQIQSLRWIQENIREFGGNPDKVLVFGTSAGGASVAHLMLSKLSKGLFHAVIAQSGTATNEWSLQRNPLSQAHKISAALECTTNETKGMVKCFRNASTEDLVLKSSNLLVILGIPVSFGPVLEIRGGHGFITTHPLEALKNGQIENRVPFITGVVRDEGFLSTYMIQDYLKSRGRQFFEEEFPNLYVPYLTKIKPEMREISRAIQTEYFGNRDMDNPQDFLDGFEEFLADTMFFIGTDEMLKYMAMSGVPTYAYRYTYESPEATNMTASFLKIPCDGKVTHGTETMRMFKMRFFPDTPEIPETENDKFMTKILTTVWSNFANTHTPSFAGTPIEDKSLEWQQYNMDNPNYMDLNLTPTMFNGKQCNRSQFWTVTVPELVKNHYQKMVKNEL